MEKNPFSEATYIDTKLGLLSAKALIKHTTHSTTSINNKNGNQIHLIVYYN